MALELVRQGSRYAGGVTQPWGEGEEASSRWMCVSKSGCHATRSVRFLPICYILHGIAVLAPNTVQIVTGTEVERDQRLKSKQQIGIISHVGNRRPYSLFFLVFIPSYNEDNNFISGLPVAVPQNTRPDQPKR